MKVGVVIVTFKRLPLLRKCLEQLFLQSKEVSEELDLQIHVGVNGVDEQSYLASQAMGANAVKIFPPQSPAAARNSVLSHLDSDWVFFIDDDAWIPTGFLKHFWKVLNEYPDADVFGGPNLTPPDSTIFEMRTGWALSSKFGSYLSTQRYSPGPSSEPCGEAALILCNLFVRRSLLGSTSFPENFVCCEESWLLQEIFEKGGKLRYVPDLYVYHHRRATVESLFRQVFKYGEGRGQMSVRRKDLIRWPHIIPSLSVFLGGILLLKGSWNLFFLYGVLCLIFAHRAVPEEKRDIQNVAGTAIIFPVVHVAYGMGFLKGLWR